MSDASPRPITVTRLAITAVKGMRLGEVEQVALDLHGARGDRAFYVIDERGRMINGKQVGRLQTIVTAYDPEGGELTLSFPSGASVQGQAGAGEPVATRFFSRPRQATLVAGPWSEALSAFLERPVKLVQVGSAVDRGRVAGASLISRASLERLAGAHDGAPIDPRRFRMLIEIDGVATHEEDGWIGRRLRVGGARLKFNGNIGRCLVTSRDPETGEIDLPTLDLLGGYRREVPTTEPLPFGIYGQVLEPGPVRVGDEVVLEEVPVTAGTRP